MRKKKYDKTFILRRYRPCLIEKKGAFRHKPEKLTRR
ncbi:hypothetical protein STM14_2079 [Salmonella enterica subsp. enterica serovar Typhimurium str. 14028S]|uniref:Uncharacterized protein n=2 Tax=Salmonella enterica I TaxID=59201 RepID=A0A0F6B209_SALT1|nr:hypothetical protein SPAB_01528 [Salmonella enterica subsp. enterica serovar Paratyphi B str. SPB7]ACY88547.1 hypothetical protein STM14_2079 [Salmonella enterica subsp. enterica serovar Typhimurium str. 14028S]